MAEQSDRYMAKLPEHLARWADTLILDDESNGEEVFFKDVRDPKPRSRRVFAFHRPETLLEWAKTPGSMRARFTTMPTLNTTNLRDCQIKAVRGLEALKHFPVSNSSRLRPREYVHTAATRSATNGRAYI